MEEDYKNANFMVYKYRYLFVILVGVLVYYVLNKQKYTMNAQILGAIAGGVITLVGINIYTANEVIKHFQNMKSYSRNMVSGGMESDGVDTGMGDDVSLYQGGNNCMNNRSMIMAGEDINLDLKGGTSALARSIYTSVEDTPQYKYASSVFEAMQQDDSNKKNTNIDIPKGRVEIPISGYQDAPQSVEEMNMARSAPQTQPALAYTLF